MKTLNDLIALSPQIHKIAAKYGVHEVKVFGSIARGEQTKNSDIDLLIEAPQGFSLFTFAHLQQELQEFIGEKVDLITSGGLHYYLRDRILAEAKPI